MAETGDMTGAEKTNAEERSTRLIEGFKDDVRKLHGKLDAFEVACRWLENSTAQIIREAEEAARREERKACAKIADKATAAANIAVAIRARNTENDQKAR